MNAVGPQVDAPIPQHESSHTAENRRDIRHVVGDSLTLHSAEDHCVVVLGGILFGDGASLKTPVAVDSRDAADEEDVVGLDRHCGRTGGWRWQNRV